MHELRPAYDRYIEEVSPARMAASFQTCALLLQVCREREAKDVADFGSGFTSYVLAHYAATADYPVNVTSVDDNPIWLDATRAFLDSYGYSSDLMLWDDYLKEPHYHDVVLYDMGCGDFREAGMGPVADRADTIIFDDAQHRGHRHRMREVCEARRMSLRFQQAVTQDQFGRFAALAVREEPMTAITPRADTIPVLYANACRTPSDIYEHLPTFAQFVVELNAQKVIELGTRGAVSTVAWLYGLDLTGGHLWSVDLDPAPKLASDRWTFIQGDDLDSGVVNALPDNVDIVFIDTSHAYEDTLAELNVYRWKVRPGGKIVLHDTELARPLGLRGQPPFPVKRAIEEFCSEEMLSWKNYPNNFGLGVIDIPEE